MTQKSFLTYLTTLLVMGILFFGLRPLTWPNFNQVKLTGDGGLLFHSPAIAYVADLPSLESARGKNDFSLCLSLTPAKQHPGFRPILMFHDGRDETQLTLAQWKSSVIAMNGDDYNFRRKLPRIVGDELLTSGLKHVIGLNSDEKGVRLFENGSLISTKQSMRLSIPDGDDTLYLVLGNSVYGNAGWEGILHNLAMYIPALSDQELRNLCTPSPDTTALSNLGKQPQLLYTFADLSSEKIPDMSGNGQDLIVPLRPMALRQVILSPPWTDFHITKNLIVDIFLNFIGFIPLGAALYSRLRLSKAFSMWYPARSTVIICFLLSLAIELAQGWLPNRSSSQLDLILNSFGAGAGVLLVKYNWQRLTQLVNSFR